ncbi:MAG: hypothetical protein DRO52_05375 [Candidatus Hecatellales archaeon]|nr:MAG: hypothetical protein DRO52_05375 [Candidatus Hecatellales archaeon]
MLITGIGGPGGIAVAESLRKADHAKYYLLGVDCDPYAPGRVMVDDFSPIPPAVDDGFVASLLRVSKGFDALFCTVDEELPKVSSYAKEFECKVFVSPFKAVATCLDKFKTFKALRRAGIPVPNTIPYKLGVKGTLEAFDYPLIVKPRHGRGSRNIFKVASRRELEAVGQITGNMEMLIQEYVEGPEYTVDVLANEKSELVACVPRERIRIRTGLTIVGRTVKNGRFTELAEKIAKTLELKYIFNFQCRGVDLKVTEVNPRPSGTMILSTMAGVNMPKILLEEELKPKAYLDKFKENVWLYRNLNNYVVVEQV